MANNPLLRYVPTNKRGGKMAVPMFLREYSNAESRRETPEQIARRAPNAVEIAAEEAARKANAKKVRDVIRQAVDEEMSRPAQQRRDVANIGR